MGHRIQRSLACLFIGSKWNLARMELVDLDLRKFGAWKKKSKHIPLMVVKKNMMNPMGSNP